MKKVTLTNSFHRSEITLNGEIVDNYRVFINKSQVRRARNTLCGIAECMCGGTAGERDSLELEPLPDGSAYLIVN